MVAAAREQGVPLLAVPGRRAVHRRHQGGLRRAGGGRAGRAGGGGRPSTARSPPPRPAAGASRGCWRSGPGRNGAAAVLDAAGRLLGLGRRGRRAPGRGGRARWPTGCSSGVCAPAPRSAPPPAPCACSRWAPAGCAALLAVSGAGDGADRLVLQGMVSLLSLELERRHLLGADRRRERAGALRRILAPGVTPTQAAHLLAVAGLPARVRGLAVEPGAGDSAEVAADLALALPGGLVRVHEGLVEALAVEEVDAPARAGPVRPGPAGRRRAGGVRSPGVGLGARGPLGRGRQPPLGSGRGVGRAGQRRAAAVPGRRRRARVASPTRCCCRWSRPTAPAPCCRPSRPGWSWAARPRRPPNGWACTGTPCATGSTGPRC